MFFNATDSSAIDMAEVAETIPVIQDLPPDIRAILLNVVLFLIILALVWVLRRVVVRILMAPARRLVDRTPNQADNTVVDAAENPLQLVVVAAAIAIAVTVLNFGADVQDFALRLSQAFIAAAITFFAYNLVGLMAQAPLALERSTGINIPDRLIPFLKVVLRVLVLVLGGFVILQTMGFNVTGLLASFGVIGLAFSLAAQDTASNIFGFTAIVSDNPFQMGDYIVLEETGAKIAGIIEKVGMRSTHIRKLDQSLVIVPNSNFTNAPVTNWSRLSKRRMDFHIGLTYDTTASQIEDIVERIRSMLLERPHVDADSVFVAFVSFGASSLDIRIIAYILLADWNAWTAEVAQINLEIMRMVEDAGLSMAFPSRSLYIEQMPKMPEEMRREVRDEVRESLPEPKRKPQKDAADTPPSDVPDQANESASNDDGD